MSERRKVLLARDDTSCRDKYRVLEGSTFVVQRIGRVVAVADPALAWSNKMRVHVGGAGTVAHAGVVLPRLLADRLGLTGDLAGVLARAGFTPLRHRGRLLVDTACALAAGATALTDVEALMRQEEIYGPDGGASDTTVLRGLDELAERLGGNGLPLSLIHI